MNEKSPICLFLTRCFPENTAQSTCKTLAVIAHPNETEAFGQEFILGKKGSRFIVKFKGEVWEASRKNNTEFFKRYDKIKGAFWWPKRKEGVYWFDDIGRVNAWGAMWK